MFGLRRLILPLALGVVVVSAPRPYAEEAKVNNEPTSLELRVLAITDSILQHHIDPPTQQQMILDGVKALYRANNQLAPNGLSRRVSELSTPEQILTYLNSVCAEFEQLPNSDGILINGMFETVPGYCRLIKADDAKVQEQIAANRYVGIGITLEKKEKLLSIPKVFYEGPAWKAGVKANDLILEIDGEATEYKDMARLVKQLRGEEGSEVTLVVRQPDSEPRELRIIRGVTFIPTVEGSRQISEGQWQYTVGLDKDIALLRIKSIGPSTLHELRKVEAKLRGKEIRGIVLDLRGGGGMLHDTVMLADQLLDGGTIGYVRTVDSVRKYEARPGCLFKNIPMAVLIAEHSQTDRVFLTAALQDQKRAVVVGEPTSNANYVNGNISISGGDQIRLAIGVTQRGDGTTLLRRKVLRRTSTVRVAVAPKATERVKKRPGFIVPDYVVRFSPVPPSRSAQKKVRVPDPILAKAIDVLRNSDAQAQPSAKKEAVSK